MTTVKVYSTFLLSCHSVSRQLNDTKWLLEAFGQFTDSDTRQGKVFRLSLNRTTPIYACRKAFATDLSLPNSVNVQQSTTKRIARKSKIECTDHLGQYFLINFYLKKNIFWFYVMWHLLEVWMFLMLTDRTQDWTCFSTFFRYIFVFSKFEWYPVRPKSIGNIVKLKFGI